MNYVKKMCILRQIKQGFSGDGKTLSGLIKIEQYGKNLAVEVSIINFAPLVSGEYYCLLSDGKGKTEMLALRGKSMFNILSDVDVSAGFCGIICYVKNEVVPIAYGINGNGSYDWRAILNKTMPPVFPKKRAVDTAVASDESEEERAPAEKGAEGLYNDEAVATSNYFEEEQHAPNEPLQAAKNANVEGTTQTQGTKGGASASTNENAESVLDAFNRRADGYYLSVKRELDELFATYPKDDTLAAAFQRSEWVRLRGTKSKPEYLVGAVYEDGRAQYICYALLAENKELPPEEIKNVCSFVPSSPLVDADGFFVIFQSAATGECMKPPRG